MKNINIDFNNLNFQQQILEYRKSMRTKSSMKWGLVFLFGVLPMLGAWFLLGGRPNGSNAFLDVNEGMSFLNINYSYQWLIAIVITFLGLFIINFFIKFNKYVKPDVYTSFLVCNFIIVNFWLFNIGDWRWLTLIPMALLALIISVTIRFFVFVFKLREQMKNLEGMNIDPNTFVRNFNNNFNNTNNNQGKNKNNHNNNDDETIDINDENGE